MTVEIRCTNPRYRQLARVTATVYRRVSPMLPPNENDCQAVALIAVSVATALGMPAKLRWGTTHWLADPSQQLQHAWCALAGGYVLDSPGRGIVRVQEIVEKLTRPKP